MSAKQRGLGRGLGALIGDFQEEPESGAVTKLPLQKVEPNPDQPRRTFDEEELQALADSIAAHGILQPLAVRASGGGFYQIIAGERRWRAARMAGLSEVPVVVLEADDRTVMELALVENLQRQDLNPMEEAEGLSAPDEGIRPDAGGGRRARRQVPPGRGQRPAPAAPAGGGPFPRGGRYDLGRARPRHPVAPGGPPAEGGRAEDRRPAPVRAAGRGHVQADAAGGGKAGAEARSPDGRLCRRVRKSLTRRLDRKVRIVNGKRKGRFELEFYGQEDLQRLYDALLALGKTEETPECLN